MHILTFRLSMFGDFKQFTPTSVNTIVWTQALQKAGYDFLPSIFQPQQPIINVPFVSVQVSPNDKRMQFVSPNGDISVRILSERLDVEFTQGIADDPEQHLIEKSSVAAKIMELMLHTLGDINGSRLAYFVDALIPEQNGKSFNAFYQKHNMGISMNNPSDECVEWSHRFNRRVLIDVSESQSELCNAIFSTESGLLQVVNSSTGEQQTMRGLHILADINTLSENSVERFTSCEFNAFIEKAQSIYLDILSQINSKLWA